MTRSVALLLVLLCALAGAPAGAGAGEDEITAELTARKVVRSAAGVESRETVETFRPGDVIEYRATYTNPGTGVVKHFAGTLPLPDWAAYQPGAAGPAAITVSSDGEVFGPPPLKRTVKLPDGRSTTREIPAGEYRFVRWSLGDLAPGASATGVLRVRVGPAGKPVPGASR
jgi:hypothetical protein